VITVRSIRQNWKLLGFRRRDAPRPHFGGSHAPSRPAEQIVSHYDVPDAAGNFPALPRLTPRTEAPPLTSSPLRHTPSPAPPVSPTAKPTTTTASGAPASSPNAGAAAAKPVGPLPVGNSTLLGAKLGPKPWPIASEAHHIFPSSQFNTRLGRKLHDWGIDLNGAENGVWLPKYHFTGRLDANGVGPCLHRGMHNRAYTDVVLQRLRLATTKDEAVAVLASIRDDLLTSRLTLNGAR
jgi:hypothetical protein